jgi:hypothetical protein
MLSFLADHFVIAKNEVTWRSIPLDFWIAASASGEAFSQ